MEELVANGCSYMLGYGGDGIQDLARRLQIPESSNIARAGSSNSRIIRTTLKHSYQTNKKTFYVIGLSFICRWEISVSEPLDEFEGKWVNVANSEFPPQYGWTKKDSESFTELNFKGAMFGMQDILDDLIFRLLSMLSDLRSRGHQALIYSQIDKGTERFFNEFQLKLLRQETSFIDALQWCAVTWQRSQGVPAIETDTSSEDCKHLEVGYHDLLNKFLTDYIKQHNILK